MLKVKAQMHLQHRWRNVKHIFSALNSIEHKECLSIKPYQSTNM